MKLQFLAIALGVFDLVTADMEKREASPQPSVHRRPNNLGGPRGISGIPAKGVHCKSYNALAVIDAGTLDDQLTKVPPNIVKQQPPRSCSDPYSVTSPKLCYGLS
ncbi:hypothetical protein BCR37DRAFT_389582 [Protomyces lactucae-debilis]|uniref:Uncharacterized protein n=1 Tax=Protomyces lactucae-debilis TaxID=2754530 RepID=A0A1Y2EXA6_PROLT|nr:uncharacterized protein BCR37DRAFT_389582 [Protomyces lactucae-debilis]ORY75756.1 hypothetical protein BCR37DRAFT_389582 [Protomyces lactucae-debilis]